jgi:hypothetical protein
MNSWNVRSPSFWLKTVYLHLTQDSDIKDLLIFCSRKKTGVHNVQAVGSLTGTNKHFEYYSLKIELKSFMMSQIRIFYHFYRPA